MPKHLAVFPLGSFRLKISQEQNGTGRRGKIGSSAYPKLPRKSQLRVPTGPHSHLPSRGCYHPSSPSTIQPSITSVFLGLIIHPTQLLVLNRSWNCVLAGESLEPLVHPLMCWAPPWPHAEHMGKNAKSGTRGAVSEGWSCCTSWPWEKNTF